MALLIFCFVCLYSKYDRNTKRKGSNCQHQKPLTVEVPTNQQQQKVEKKIITLQGPTTSRVEQALKSRKIQGQNPYPTRVFLRLDCVDCHNTKQLCQALKCEECAEKKCRNCEIPVFLGLKMKKIIDLNPKSKKLLFTSRRKF